MKLSQKLAAMFSLALVPFALAQEHRSYFSDDSAAHPYVAKLGGGVLSQSGSWDSGTGLRSYADTHEGRYVVFADGGKLYKLEPSSQLDAAEKLYAPMKELQAQQKAFAEKQKPLAAQQHELSVQMKAARGNIDEIQRIAHEMSAVGEQQGALGREQGELGRKQGEIGRAFHERVERMIDDCLKNKTCPAV